MIFIERGIHSLFAKKVLPNKVLILLGARRVGKTAFIKNYLSTIPESEYLQLNGEDMDDAALLKERSIINYTRLLADKKLLVIDEAQNIPEIGLILKLIVDSIEGIKVIATSSSVFDLSNKLGEPLVGRKNTIYLFPFAQMEFTKQEDYKETISKLEERMLFGSYPELEQYPDWNDKTDYLKEIINSYLLKDILVYEGIKQSNKILDLLKLIAFQTYALAHS